MVNVLHGGVEQDGSATGNRRAASGACYTRGSAKSGLWVGGPIASHHGQRCTRGDVNISHGVTDAGAVATQLQGARVDVEAAEGRRRGCQSCSARSVLDDGTDARDGAGDEIILG